MHLRNLASASIAMQHRAAEFSPNRPFAGKGVVMSLLQGSEYYHRRAGELRQAAGEARSADNRETLLSFAADFDGLAAEAECAERRQAEAAAP
jgi:hypothetical protein